MIFNIIVFQTIIYYWVKIAQLLILNQDNKKLVNPINDRVEIYFRGILGGDRSI